MIVGKDRRKARDAAISAAKHAGTTKGTTAAVIAVAHALLEVGFQLGRIAEQFPVYGPPQERR